MRKFAVLLLVLALGCVSNAPADETAKIRTYVFYFKNPAGEGTVGITADGNTADAAIGDGASLRFDRDTGGLIGYHARTATGYIDLQFANNEVTRFEQGYASGNATYYYGKNGTRVVYNSQDRISEATINFTPNQDALVSALSETAGAYVAFFAKPDQRYAKGTKTINGFECDSYETGNATQRRELCYSGQTDSVVLDASYSKLDGLETETSRVELRSYMEG